MVNNTGGFEEEGVQAQKPKKTSLNLDREVNLKINPAKVGKVGLVVVVLLAVFFLGRLSANSFELTGLATGDTIEEVEEVVEEPEVEKEVVDTEPEEVSEEEPEEVVEDEEEIVDTYKNVKVQVNNVEVEWKETWGKITKLRYSITNNEDGTILPSHFLVMVEGYKDAEKEAYLDDELTKIKSGQVQSGVVTLDKPFNYNEVTAGNLDSVQVRIILFDVDSKPIASFQNEFNLKG